MKRAAVACLLLLAGACSSSGGGQQAATTSTTVTPSTTAAAPTTTTTEGPGTSHLEYVLLDGSIVVYDIDNGHRQVEQLPLPATTKGVRGVTAHPADHALYVSYGGDGPPNGNGSVLRYDLVARRVVWDRHYGHGVDSLAVSADGTVLYVPTGEQSTDGLWHIVRADTGDETGTIKAGPGAHNTVIGASGRVYLGSRDHDELLVYDPAADKVVKHVGRLKAGVRPFAVNGRETLAFTTATRFLGFQVSDLATGRVLHTLTFAGFSYDPKRFAPSAPSHGLTLSPDEREVYVVDGPNSVVHVFDVTGLPAAAPRPIADIRLVHPFAGTSKPCAYDCARDGWVQHSRDGRYVYVGDSGDVIDTATKKVAAYLPALNNTRKCLEIDWRGGVPVFTTTRHGLGYVGR